MQYSLYSIGPCFYHQSHPQLGVVFAWFHPFILSGVISPLISSSILGTYRPGEFLFQYSIILPFHTVHGFLKARILKWFAVPFSSGPHSVMTNLGSILKSRDFTLPTKVRLVKAIVFSSSHVWM